MRVALWRTLRERIDNITAPRFNRLIPGRASVAARPEPVTTAASESGPELGDLDLRQIWAALVRKKRWVIVPTLVVALAAIVIVNLVTPRYKSEARILIDGRENVFLRPNADQQFNDRYTVDPEAVTSQVQLLLSRDLAREIIKKNNLAKLPEFDPLLRGYSPVKAILGLIGIGRDPFRMTPEERVLDAYFDRLQVYAVDKSRVLVVEFQSSDPDLAARVANSIADGYLTLQQNARREQATSAGQWLSGEIDKLRVKVSDAEKRVEDFRSKSSLFIGTNNTTLSNQQMGELNTQLNNARAQKADAEAKARLIREMLQSGKPIEASEILNSELMRRLDEQRVTLRAQLAEQSATLLDNHPRIRELKAQISDLDHQIRDEARRLSRSLENDARIASARVDTLSASLDQLKHQATATNGEDVHLRALEREAKAQRDLLESYLARYREATARESIDVAPTDGRIISRAMVSNTPAYPKKLPIVLIATLATLMLTAGSIATSELLRMTAPGVAARTPPVFPAAFPAEPAPARGTPAHVMPAQTASAEAPEWIEPTSVPAQPSPLSPTVQQASPETASAPSIVDELDRLSGELRAAGPAARKITVLGTGSNDAITMTALELARMLARSAKVVLVEMSSSPSILANASSDPSAPGLADLMRGEASFGQIITSDRASRLHLVSGGRPGTDRALLQSPRLSLALDALLRVYDHVLLDVGAESDAPASLVTADARAVVVPDPATSEEGRRQFCDQLRAVGFGEVSLLSRPVTASDSAWRTAAA